jgi:tRNA(fMet)-specific endonuclease VapC
VRHALEQAGNGIGPFDMLTAGLVLVSNNTREFLRVSGLPVEDWQQP